MDCFYALSKMFAGLGHKHTSFLSYIIDTQRITSCNIVVKGNDGSDGLRL